MRSRKQRIRRTACFRNTAAAWMLALLFSASPGRAIVFHSTDSSSYNTTAPTGALTNSGWQFEGAWAGCMGTAIASNFFITAKHVGGAVGGTFSLNGASYTTTAVFNDPGSDLALWKVNSTFSAWASLYTAHNEVGSSLVVFGAGSGRGAEVRVEGELKGWQWSGPQLKRWGQNVVKGATNYYGSTLLYADFNAGAGPNEATLAIADSGGGVFIQQDSTWRLAGVNFAVDNPFNTTNTGAGFNAAIYDAGGLYYQDGSDWRYLANQSYNIPASFYATSVSARQNWILGIIVPEPSPSWLVAVGAAGLSVNTRRRSRRPRATRPQPCDSPAPPP